MTFKQILWLGVASLTAVSMLTPSALAQEGAVILDTRLRVEIVDRDGRENTEALTFRARAGYKYNLTDNWSVLGEAEGILHLNDDFADTVEVRPNFAVVADPEALEINRLQIAYKDDKTTAVLGRQRIILDGARFVGNVGFRQNEQTFDAFRATHKLTDTVKAEYVYVDKVHRIFGDESPNGEFESDSHIFCLAAKTDFGDLVGYGLLLDFDNATGASGQTWGAKWSKAFKTDIGNLKLSAEAALQSEYQGNGPVSDVGYQAVSLHFTRGNVTANFSVETLEGSGGRGFITPLATLHKFQGWADVFLATPATGIRDIQIGLKSSMPNIIKSQKPITFGAVYHDFTSDNGDIDLGHEFDAIIKVPVTSKITFEGKLALFNGSSNGPADRNKFWLALSASF